MRYLVDHWWRGEKNKADMNSDLLDDKPFISRACTHVEQVNMAVEQVRLGSP